jgi:hypothetical protein
LIPLLWLVLAAQIGPIFPGPGTFASAPAATPGFVSEYSSNSTLTVALGTQTSGICVSFSYCANYPEPTLSGNLGILTFQYANGSTTTPTTATAHDDASNTYTCITGAVETGSGKWNGLCYASGMTAGAHSVWVTFGTTAVTQVAMKAAQYYNIAASSALDVSGSAAGTSSTTANAVSVTTTAPNDLVYVQVCRTGTPSTSSFTVGSGYTFGTTDINDGCATEWKIASSTGSVTPSMTMATASTYVEFVAAFKSATAGTAPTGMYVSRIMSWGPSTTSITTWPMQFPTTGNLLINSVVGTLTPAAVPTDGTNTWTAAGSVHVGSVSAGNSLEYYAANAAPNSTGLITAHTTGSSGDATFSWYEVQNAATNPYVARSIPDCGGSCSSPVTTSVVSQITNGLVLGAGGQAFNTFLSCTPSGCRADSSTTGGQDVSGPYQVWQNNFWFHYWLSNPATVAYSLALSGSLANNWETDFVSFLSPTGIGIVNQASNQAKTTQTLAITVPATRVGSLLTVNIGSFNATARTVSKVCTDGTTCAAGHSFTQGTGCIATDAINGLSTDCWYLLSATAGVTTVTVTLSSSASNVEAQYYEVVKGDGSAWTFDGGNHTNSGTVSASTATGPAVTTTGAADFCASNVAVTNLVTANPKAGNEFINGGTLFSNTGDGAVALLTTTAGSHNAAWTDASGTFTASIGCWK